MDQTKKIIKGDYYELNPASGRYYKHPDVTVNCSNSNLHQSNQQTTHPQTNQPSTNGVYVHRYLYGHNSYQDNQLIHRSRKTTQVVNENNQNSGLTFRQIKQDHHQQSQPSIKINSHQSEIYIPPLNISTNPPTTDCNRYNSQIYHHNKDELYRSTTDNKKGEQDRRGILKIKRSLVINPMDQPNPNFGGQIQQQLDKYRKERDQLYQQYQNMLNFDQQQSHRQRLMSQDSDHQPDAYQTSRQPNHKHPKKYKQVNTDRLPMERGNSQKGLHHYHSNSVAQLRRNSSSNSICKFNNNKSKSKSKQSPQRKHEKIEKDREVKQDRYYLNIHKNRSPQYNSKKRHPNLSYEYNGNAHKNRTSFSHVQSGSRGHNRKISNHNSDKNLHYNEEPQIYEEQEAGYEQYQEDDGYTQMYRQDQIKTNRKETMILEQIGILADRLTYLQEQLQYSDQRISQYRQRITKQTHKKQPKPSRQPTESEEEEEEQDKQQSSLESEQLAQRQSESEQLAQRQSESEQLAQRQSESDETSSEEIENVKKNRHREKKISNSITNYGLDNKIRGLVDKFYNFSGQNYKKGKKGKKGKNTMSICLVGIIFLLLIYIIANKDDSNTCAATH